MFFFVLFHLLVSRLLVSRVSILFPHNDCSGLVFVGEGADGLILVAVREGFWSVLTWGLSGGPVGLLVSSLGASFLLVAGVAVLAEVPLYLWSVWIVFHPGEWAPVLRWFLARGRSRPLSFWLTLQCRALLERA